VSSTLHNVKAIHLKIDTEPRSYKIQKYEAKPGTKVIDGEQTAFWLQ
jgi:hypothetical protein